MSQRSTVRAGREADAHDRETSIRVITEAGSAPRFDKDPFDKDPHDRDAPDFDRDNFDRDNFDRA